MKKGILLGTLGLLALAFLAGSGYAVGPIDFFIHGGSMTPDDFSFNPVFGVAGVNLDLELSPFFMISPECDLIIYKFSFNPIWITPAVTANLNFSSLFVGAGAALPIIIGSGYTLEGNLLLKLNAGIKSGNFKLQVFAYSPFEELFEDMWVGATLGFGI